MAMDKTHKGNATLSAKRHDLQTALHRAREHSADRDDVVVDLKNAQQARLDLLASDLLPVMEDLPKDNDQFEFAITHGEPPRLWIDMTSFVRMGRDGREYEFVKDTRLGRNILARSSDRDMIGKKVTDYIAHRVLERERAIEGDWLVLAHSPPEAKLAKANNQHTQSSGDHGGETRAKAVLPTEPSNEIRREQAEVHKGHSALAVAVWFLIGIGLGILGLLALATFGNLSELTLLLGR